MDKELQRKRLTEKLNQITANKEQLVARANFAEGAIAAIREELAELDAPSSQDNAPSAKESGE